MKIINVALISGLLAVSSHAFAGPTSDARPPGSPLLVEINGTKITLADFERKRPTAMFQALNTYYESQRKATEEFVDEYLLEEEAKKQHLTVAQLLDREVNSKLAKDPSEEALRVYFEGVDTTEPFEAVRGKIIDALRQRRSAKLKTAYMQTLRSAAKISFRLPPPRAAVSLAATPVRGTAGAPVTLVEFADYECPYCQQIQPVIERLETEYKGKLVFAYKDFPLSMHPNAQKAAEASRCAEAQGKYWELHDRLVTHKQLDVPGLKKLARDLKLDGEAFDKCVDSGEKAAAVTAHAAEAQALGLQGTPTFFMNGRYLSGALSYETLKAMIEEELAGASAVANETAKR